MQLIHDLGLENEIVVADAAARRRFVFFFTISLVWSSGEFGSSFDNRAPNSQLCSFFGL
jgi:hypothetical protein